MVANLLNLKKEKMKYDESDALAVALCHSFRIKKPVKKSKDWKAYIEANLVVIRCKIVFVNFIF